jgi:hypothetical protein
MNDRRHLGLDAVQLKDVLLRVLARYGKVDELPSGDITVTLAHLDQLNLNLSVKDAAMSSLAEQLRVVTAIDTSREPSALARQLAQVTLTVYRAGLSLGGPTDAKELGSLVGQVSRDYAIETALVFAWSRKPVLYPDRLDRTDTRFALTMNDDNLLGEIFEESFAAPLIARPGRHSKAASTSAIPRTDSNGADSATPPERLLTATSFFGLLRSAEVRTWTDREVVSLIRAYYALEPPISPPLALATASQYHFSEDDWSHLYDSLFGQDTTTSLSDSGTYVQAVGRPPTGGLLSSTSFLNLFATKELCGWTNRELVRLLHEHYTGTLEIPAANPAIAAHNNSVSGEDWSRLYSAVFGPSRGAL